ncbi:hypothetical protein QOT17_014599 [Balamuthia mandrillaris]
MKEEVGLKQDHPPLGGNIEKLERSSLFCIHMAETSVKNNKTPTATSRNIAALLDGRAMVLASPTLACFCEGAQRKCPRVIVDLAELRGLFLLAFGKETKPKPDRSPRGKKETEMTRLLEAVGVLFWLAMVVSAERWHSRSYNTTSDDYVVTAKGDGWTWFHHKEQLTRNEFLGFSGECAKEKDEDGNIIFTCSGW